jgi:hypothetical protein
MQRNDVNFAPSSALWQQTESTGIEKYLADKISSLSEVLRKITADHSSNLFPYASDSHMQLWSYGPQVLCQIVQKIKEWTEQTF